MCRRGPANNNGLSIQSSQALRIYLQSALPSSRPSCKYLESAFYLQSALPSSRPPCKYLERESADLLSVCITKKGHRCPEHNSGASPREAQQVQWFERKEFPGTTNIMV